MPRICTVCAHPEREVIDRALVAGEPYRSIAQRFAASPDAVYRHRAHLPEVLTKTAQATAVAHADNLLDQVKELQTRALALLEKAEAAGDIRAGTGAIREARQTIELVARMVGELDERPTINVLMTSEWLHLRERILRRAAACPEVKEIILDAVAGEGNDEG